MRFEGRDRYPVATTLQDFLVRSEEVTGLRPVNDLTVPTLQLRFIEAQRLFSTVCSPQNPSALSERRGAA